MKYINDDEVSDIRKNDLCYSGLLYLGYNIKKNTSFNYANLFKDMLCLSKTFSDLKDHDYMLKVSLKYNKYNISDFILKIHNYFESILMLLNGVNKEIKLNIVDFDLVSNYIIKLYELRVDYLPELKNKVRPYVYSQISFRLYWIST
jgi:hypothetical protein